MKKAYRVVRLTFLDHAYFSKNLPKDKPRLFTCEVYGVLRKTTKKAYHVVPWVCGGNVSDPNNETYVIAKKLVLAKQILYVP